jgi:hypothetical protein
VYDKLLSDVKWKEISKFTMPRTYTKQLAPKTKRFIFSRPNMGEVLHTDNIRRWVCTVSMHISTNIMRTDMRMEVDERFIKKFVNCWKTHNWVDFY